MVHERVKQRARGSRPARLLPFEVRRFLHCCARDPDASRENRADEKGIRHPHESKLAALIELTVSKETPTARSPPTSLNAEASEVIKPRLLRGAPSSR